MACKRGVGIALGSGQGLDDGLEQRGQIGIRAGHPDPLHGPTLAGHRRDDGEVDVVVGRVEVEEQLVDLVEHLVGALVLAIDLVDDHHCRQSGRQRLGQHVAGLGQGSLGRVDQQQHAVDQGQRPLDLAAEVGVAWCVDQVDADVAPLHRGRLGQDGDAPLALLVVRVHDAVDQRLVRTEDVGGSQHGIDQGCLPVIDVGDEGEVTKGRGPHRFLRGDTRRHGHAQVRPHTRDRVRSRDGRESRRDRGHSCA